MPSPHAFVNQKKKPQRPLTNSYKITEEEKKAWIKKNTFYCKRLDIWITNYACTTYQKTAITAPAYVTIKKCLGCKKFDKKLIRDAKKKTCKLHIEYPGYCLGEGLFLKPANFKDAEWSGKKFCTQKCGVRYNNFIKNGWTSPDKIPKKYRGKINNPGRLT